MSAIGILVYLGIAIWIFVDAKRRKSNPGTTLVAVLLIGIISIPLYFAQRNLKAGEIRKGGRGWNFVRYFIPIFSVVYFLFTAQFLETVPTRVFLVWFAISAITVGAGFLVRKPDMVEKGPTGALANLVPSDALPANSSHDDPQQKLQKIREMLDKKLITQDDFEKLKADILKKL